MDTVSRRIVKTQKALSIHKKHMRDAINPKFHGVS